MMKVHYIKVNNMLYIFGEVDKKRTDWNNKNVVCIRAYDLKTNIRSTLNPIPEAHQDITSVDEGRKFWDWVIKFATEHNHEIQISEAINKTMDGSAIMTDSEITKEMDEIALKKMNSTEHEKITEQIFDKLGIITDEYKAKQ